MSGHERLPGILLDETKMTKQEEEAFIRGLWRSNPHLKHIQNILLVYGGLRRTRKNLTDFPSLSARPHNVVN
eukprot:g78463.t1